MIAWDPNYLRGGGGGGEFKQTRRKATWKVSAGSKQLKIAKRKVENNNKKNHLSKQHSKQGKTGEVERNYKMFTYIHTYINFIYPRILV